MKREIKFRAWDGENMLYPVQEGHLSARDMSANFIRHYDEVMEWTGLKDKNGTDAYEGDKVVDNLGEEFVITWDYAQLARLAQVPFTIKGNIYEAQG